MRNIFLRLEYFFTRSRRNGARKRAIALAESRSRCLAGECEHARECESRRSSAEQSSLAHYDRGAAPMPAFSPATLFSPRAAKYLIIEILYLRRYTYNVHVVVIKFIFVSFVIVKVLFPYFQQENLRRKYNVVQLRALHVQQGSSTVRVVVYLRRYFRTFVPSKVRQ